MANDAQKAGLTNYLRYFRALDQGLNGLDECLHPQVIFQDPFNRVQGPAAVRLILQHFIDHVEQPAFGILNEAWSESVCFVRWDFSGHLAGLGDWQFPGVSEIHFDEEGRVTLHLDHWDAAAHFLNKLPVLGALNRFVSRKLTHIDTY
ncbi:nuclear transport factor 2 family protein [Pokkaliibacter sp. CJK22405]|uniref:nuclear transport factor 2 family protein n=1 Tax=Pokkaliibacter sp. CJK22405 TaxID=3384615 RepID=UPI003984C7AB